jgi:hypothetical protein
MSTLDTLPQSLHQNTTSKLSIIKTKSAEFDSDIDGIQVKYYKYTATISIADEVISQFSFWHDNTIGYFADDLIHKYKDKNQVIHRRLAGIITKNYKELFKKIVDINCQKIVAEKFKKVWSHSM